VATSLLFLLFGTALGAWTARIPAVKSRLALTDGRLSIALLAFAAGCIVGMVVLGRLTDRFGASRVMLPMAFGEGLLLIPPAYVDGLVLLCLALFGFGAVHGTLNIAMNASAVEVQRAWDRPIMSSFHAIYSIGGFLGAMVGGLFARAGLGAAVTFLCVGAGVLALALWAAWWAMPSTPTPVAEASADGSGLSWYPIMVLGLLVLCALVGEGAAADWSAVYLRDNLHTSAAVATYAFAAFSAMMTVGRLVGDRLTRWLGPVRLVRASGVLAAVGLGAALLIGDPVAGIIGFGCVGAGMSCIAPQVFSAAGNRDPARAGRALSLVAGLGYLGFLLGPIMIGAVSTVVGLPAALAIPAMLALVVSLGAGVLRPSGNLLDNPRSS
jgi:predicted MFS family arabinose efflux permease